MRLLLPLVAMLAFGLVHAGDLPPGHLPEVEDHEIGYQSVAEALAALRQRRDVQISTVRGWVVIADRKNFTVWSFAPESDPGYPAVVKRVVRPRTAGGSDVVMSVLCEASKEACDNLVREFDALNKGLPGAVSDHPLVSTQGLTLNVTADSAPGWFPSAAQQEQVQRLFREYFSALDGGHYDEAYALQTPGQRSLESSQQFSKREAKFKKRRRRCEGEADCQAHLDERSR
jgi:hypothetical protein